MVKRLTFYGWMSVVFTIICIVQLVMMQVNGTSTHELIRFEAAIILSFVCGIANTILNRLP